ncbi:hypothetical protein DL769_007172 [Monosporascus sp. CRB-8-3]|nr:hypothetical protein DL769_007172 [Monosporascus sp. CRB-8-3]
MNPILTDEQWDRSIDLGLKLEAMEDAGIPSEAAADAFLQVVGNPAMVLGSDVEDFREQNAPRVEDTIRNALKDRELLTGGKPNKGSRVLRDEEPLSDANPLFNSLFTFRDMNYLAGVNIQPTDNILNHLYYDKYSYREFRPTVFFFPYASVLEDMKGSKLHQQFPGFYEETLNTLGLLFPNEPTCQEWFENVFGKNGSVEPRVGSLGHPTSREMRRYWYWKPRLLALQREFENSHPRTLAHWWRDRRKRREWITFWIAFFGAIFAVASLILSLVSAVTGSISMKQAILANALGWVSTTDGLPPKGATPKTPMTSSAAVVVTITTIETASTTTEDHSNETLLH